MRHRLVPWLFVLLVSGPLLVYLAGNGATGLFDRDEPRYAQTSRQMLRSGDWVVPHFLDKVRTAKPVLIYWCQAAAMRGLGDDAFAARLPSALGVAATVAMLAVAVGRARGAKRGLWTGFVLSSCVMACVSAKMCLTDGVLLLFVTAGQLCLYRLWRRGPEPWAVIGFGLAAGLAGLTKGPVALGVHAMTLAALWLIGRTLPREANIPATAGSDAGADAGRFRATDFPLAAGVALGVLFLVVFPWLWEVQRRAPEFLSTAIGHDVIDRVQRGQEGHSAPPGFYSVAVWGTFFPWSLLLPATLWWGWKRRALPATRFALAAWAGPWVMFELIATKLPHYVLPTYPALAYLTADLVVRAQAGRVTDLATRAFRGVVWAWAGLLALVGLAPAALLIVIGQADHRTAVGAATLAVLGAGTGVVTARRFAAGRVGAAARMMGGGTLAFFAVAYTLLLPNLRPLQLSRDVARLINAHGGYGQAGYMIEFKEPSLAFAQGGGLREMSDAHYLDRSSPADWPAWVVLPRSFWDATRADVRARWDVVGSATGIAYSDGGDQREVLVLHRLLQSSQ